jgi:serine/threonine-protein kinase HipA
LDVYLLERKAGQLVDDGRLRFTYDSDYLQAEGAQPLSLALPLAQSAYEHNACHAVFGGLLPEGNVRPMLAKALGVSERNDFSLLDEVGGECAGAVSLSRVDGPGRVAGAAKRTELGSVTLESLVKQMPSRPLLVAEGVRLTLAGAQSKLALVLEDGKLYFPGQNEPSTHILKVAPAGFEGILENELFCLRLAKAIGLPTATGTVNRAGDTEYLCVERFDRIWLDGKVKRLHQEDFCQALGVAPEAKYQNEGGPSLVEGVQLLREHSTKPATDVAAILKLVYFNYLIGNADAHSKNFSLLLGGAGPLLAPAYDLICTAAYPGLTHKMAMKIGSEYDPDRVTTRHWEALAEKCGLKANFVLEGLKELADRVTKMAPVVADKLGTEIGPRKIVDGVQAVITKRVAKVTADR